MSYKVQLSEEEIKKANKDFLIYQAEYNKTGDKKILWMNMQPLIKTALAAAILKSNHNNEVKDFEDKLENGVILLIRRYVKDYTYHQNSLPTFVHYGALLVNKTSQVIWEEQNCCEMLPEFDKFFEVDYDE